MALGRLVPVKRYDRLLPLSEALAALPTGRPHIVLAGDGPLATALGQQLESGIKAGHFEMPGHVEDPRAAMLAADALVITSDHEGIPMVALESLALGVPVFAFAVGGIPEISGAGVPLYLSAPGDIAAMAAAIDKYFVSNPRAPRIHPPSDWAFDIRCCADSYERLYQSLGWRVPTG